MDSPTYNPRVFWWSLLTTTATFPLIFIGGLVTSHHAGMAVPDWPNSYGYNMFLFPVRYWQGNILFEHVHRLAASTIGLMCIVLVVLTWWTDERRTLRWLSAAVLCGVIFQGILGGLRVIWNQLDLAMVHGCVAQAFFCLVAFMTLSASRRWAQPVGDGDRVVAQRAMKLGLIAVIVVYCQLIVAAIMRHSGAGLAVPDVPLIYGKWFPPTSSDQLKVINDLRVWKLNMPAVTLAQIWLQYIHRVGAIIVSGAVLTACGYVVSRARHRVELLCPAVALVFLLAAQITLGVATVVYRKPADVASAHVAVGALVLVTCFVMTAQAWRLGRGRDNGEKLPIIPPHTSAVSTALS